MINYQKWWVKSLINYFLLKNSRIWGVIPLGRVSNGPAFLLSNFWLLLYIKGRHNFKNVVISFLNRANPFSRVCLFCNFVRNTIYVIGINWSKLVVLARNQKFDSDSKSSIFKDWRLGCEIMMYQALYDIIKHFPCLSILILS